MKKIILSIIFVFFATSSCAEDNTSSSKKDKDSVKWQVNVEIQYNAVDKKEAEKVIKRVMEQNEGACSVKGSVQKVSDTYSLVYSTAPEYGGSVVLTIPD